jgi:DNA (cytosine-5)-methyltransferase 1
VQTNYVCDKFQAGGKPPARMPGAMKPNKNSNRRPTAISLFTGCGGSDAGLVAAGFDVVMANDILPYAKDVYLENHPETDYLLGNIEEVRAFPYCDLLAGCYPCQGFSQGGVREASRTINYLYREFGRALRYIMPKAFIVENVSGMVRADFSHLLKNQLKNFRQAGYKVKYALLNSADYGLAQERKRIIIVGLRKDLNLEYKFPSPSHGPGAPNPYFTIREAIGDLPEWPVGEFNEEPFHWYYMSRNRRRDWHEVSKTIVSHARSMPLHPISPPLIWVESDKYAFENNSPARRFSYREAARLQGFKRDFTFPDTYGMPSKYRVVGNAVPPPLFEAVARALPEIF